MASRSRRRLADSTLNAAGEHSSIHCEQNGELTTAVNPFYSDPAHPNHMLEKKTHTNITRSMILTDSDNDLELLFKPPPPSDAVRKQKKLF